MFQWTWWSPARNVENILGSINPAPRGGLPWLAKSGPIGLLGGQGRGPTGTRTVVEAVAPQESLIEIVRTQSPASGPVGNSKL